MKPNTTIVALFSIIAMSTLALAQHKANHTDKPVSAKEVKGVQVITVSVDNGKYTPATIEVKKGKPVQITFKGGKKMGCGSTVEFKSLKIKQKIEADKSVIVKFTPKDKGEIKFACPMNMYQGKVIVK